MQSTNVLFLRVDDRLIHGQVVTTWVRDLGVETIWVASDRVVGEPIEVLLLQSSVPQSIALEVLPIAEVAARAQNDALPATLMVMLENVRDLLSLYEVGFPVRAVNLGGLRYRAGRVGLSRSVYVGQEDVQALLELERLGIEMSMQGLPSDHKVNVYERLRKKWGS